MNKEEIEELAFKYRRELANLNVIDLLDIIELLQKDRKQWIYQFTNTFNESIKINETALSLYKENQELKKHLEVPKTCNLKTLEDYKSYYEDTTREQILEDTYIEYCAYVNLAHRYSELKKQLEEINKMIEKCGFVNIEQVMLNYCGLLTQQKEFIEYLENEKDRLARECSQIYEDSLGKTRYVNEDIFDEVNDVLQKYKEIIGGIK